MANRYDPELCSREELVEAMREIQHLVLEAGIYDPARLYGKDPPSADEKIDDIKDILEGIGCRPPVGALIQFLDDCRDRPTD